MPLDVHVSDARWALIEPVPTDLREIFNSTLALCPPAVAFTGPMAGRADLPMPLRVPPMAGNEEAGALRSGLYSWPTRNLEENIFEDATEILRVCG